MTVNKSSPDLTAYLDNHTSTKLLPKAMGNRFTCLGQSLDIMGHSAREAQYQAEQLAKAVVVINQ